MNKVESLTLVFPEKKKSVVNLKSEYNVDMWREFKKRWMVFGVLISVALAVLSPRLGAPGGNYTACSLIDHLERVLRTESVRWAALGAVCYVCGRGTRARELRQVRLRLCALAALHAHAAAPAVAVVTALALRDANLDRRILEGALVVRSCGPCSWLALSLRHGSSPATPALTAINYLVSLLAAPLALKFFCGQTTMAPVSSVLWTASATAVPFVVGCWQGLRAEGAQKQTTHRVAERLLALLLLYIDCCALLREAEGTLSVTDVLATLFLEVSNVSLAAASSNLYAHYGLLRPRECRALALAAVPKASALGWEMQSGCMASGLARLPSVFLAPSQALLMAALFGAEDDDQGENYVCLPTDDSHDDETLD